MISSILSNLKIILILICAITVFYFLMKYQVTRTVGVILLVFTICFTGALSTKQIVGYYSAEGKTYGTTASLFNSNAVKYSKPDKFTFSYSKLGFETTGQSKQYRSLIQDENAIDISLENQQYALLVNDTLLTNLQTVGNTIFGEYITTFKDTNGKNILTDTLQISMAIENAFTEVSITTNGGDMAVAIWNTFAKKNNFNISIKQLSIEQSQMEFIKMEFPQQDGTHILQKEYFSQSKNSIEFNTKNSTLSIELNDNYYQNLTYTRTKETIRFYINNSLFKIELLNDYSLSLTTPNSTIYYIYSKMYASSEYSENTSFSYASQNDINIKIYFYTGTVEITQSDYSTKMYSYEKYNNLIVFTDIENQTHSIILTSDNSLIYNGTTFDLSPN